MGVTKFDTVEADLFVGPSATGAEIPATTGTIFWVHSGTGNDANTGTSPSEPLATTNAARAKCTASKGDVVVWMPGHAETVSGAAGITGSVVGVTYVTLGVGNDRAQFTFGTSTAASFDLSANDCKILGYPIGIAGIDGLTKPFNITGNNCYAEIEWQDASAAVEAVTAVRLDTADNSALKLLYRGFTAGDAAIRAVAIDDCDNVKIDIDAYGVVSTAWVNMVDVASTNVSVRGRMYTQGITNFTRDVVDTITGSTWDADIFDASFGGRVSGGSAAALASDDASGISTSLATLQAEVSGAAGITSFPASAAPGNGVSIAEVIRATYDNTGGIDSAANVLGADNANNAYSSTTVVANMDGSVLERLESIQTGRLGSVPSFNNPNYFVVTADMSSATWNTQATHEIVTVTGMVRLVIIPQVTSTLTDAADGASIQLGIEGSTSAIIGSTGAAGAGGNTLSTNEFWVDTSPADVIMTEANAGSLCFTVGGGLDVGYEITGAALTGGTILFHVWWIKLDSTGACVAGTGAAL